MGWLKLVLTGYRVWTGLRPFHRLKERRKAKRAARKAQAEGLATEAQFQFDEEDTDMNSLAQQILGSLLKVVGSSVATWAVAHDVIAPAQTDGLTAALTAIVGGVATVLGLWLAHRKKSDA